MPFKSQSQRQYMYSQKPDMAAKWEKETPKNKPLPEKTKKKTNKESKKKGKS